MTQIKIFAETTYSNTSSASRNVMTTERLAEKVNDFLTENDGRITVKDIKYIQPAVAATCMGINPVNWRTDATPAMLHDTITVTLSPEYHVLVVSGYSGSEYRPYKNFINVGDIHSCEPWLYSECLKQNFAERARAWRTKHANTKK